MGDRVLLVEDIGAVRVLRMNRPDKLNALDTPLTEALQDALEAADRAPAVRALVLTGEGRGFCAGADTREFKDLRPDNQHLVTARAELTLRVQSLLREIGKPIVSAVRGAALGGGAGLAVGCDMMVAGEDAQFGYPELRHGLVPALVMTNLVRQVGPKIAFELVSTGRLLGAAELERLHLANRVVAVDDILPAAIEIAARWSAAPSQALRAAKALFYRVSDLSFADGMAAGRDVNIEMRGFSRE